MYKEQVLVPTTVVSYLDHRLIYLSYLVLLEIDKGTPNDGLKRLYNSQCTGYSKEKIAWAMDIAKFNISIGNELGYDKDPVIRTR